MKVLKFGGTSLGTASRMHNILDIIKEEYSIVVLSAVSGTTNRLVSISEKLKINKQDEAKQEIKDLKSFYRTFCNELFKSKKILAEGNEIIERHFNFLISFCNNDFTTFQEKQILAQGELISTALFYLLLQEREVNSQLIAALDFMKITKDLEPDINYIEENLSRILNNTKSKIMVTQGYICRNSFGEVDNLKRGGSDYTASLIGAAINAESIEIWTDIDGMHNNDPRVVENTHSITDLSYNEAAELAYFGAKILHPSSVYPAKIKEIPIFLKNTLKPHLKGTKISKKRLVSTYTAIAAKDNITAIKIHSSRMLLAYGFLRKIFEVFEYYKTPIDVITTSEVAVSLTIDNDENLEKIIENLKKLGEIEVSQNQSIVCVVGDFTTQGTGVGSKIFNCLKNIPIRMISYGGSKNNVSIIIKSEDKKKALRQLNDTLFND